MDVRRRILLVDVGVGVAALVGGLISLGPSAAGVWWIGGLVAAATVVLAWSEERGIVGGWTTIGLVLAFGLAFLVIGVRFGSSVVADSALPVALLGLGCGMIAYRLYFGVVRPIPERRLRGYREWPGD